MHGAQWSPIAFGRLAVVAETPAVWPNSRSPLPPVRSSGRLADTKGANSAAYWSYSRALPIARLERNGSDVFLQQRLHAWPPCSGGFNTQTCSIDLRQEQAVLTEVSVQILINDTEFL